MAAQMCALQPTSPLPLDQACAEGVYELMKENTLPTAVKELLDSVDSFVGRQQLSITQTGQNEVNCFCSYHCDLVTSSENPKALEDMWILQRDISVQLFKVMMGVVRSASDLARKMRSLDKALPHKVTRSAYALAAPVDDLDLELAFSGDARGGYQWLNCLAKDECEWVWSAINNEDEELQAQCPACLLGRAIDSESTIRLLITAARLLHWDFFVASIREHLENDPWWGPGYWESIEPKASILESQISELLQQCSSLRQRIKQQQQQQQLHTSTTTTSIGKTQLARSISSRRVFTHNLLSSLPTSASAIPITAIPMRLDTRQLHAMAEMLTISGRTRAADRISSNALLRPYNHARMANNPRLAAYCWFVLMYNVSLQGPELVLDIDIDAEQKKRWRQENRATRHKVRARTV